MPILSAFFVAITFHNVAPGALAMSVIAGTLGYGVASTFFTDLHYIHQMAVTLFACITLSLALNAVAYRRRAALRIEDLLGDAA